MVARAAKVSRLALRQAMLAMSIALLVGIVSSVVQLTLDWQQERQSLSTNLQLIIATQQVQAARAVFDLDNELAGSIAKSIVAFPAIYEARLMDGFGTLLSSEERVPTPQKWRTLADILFGDIKNKTVALFYYPDHPSIGTLTITVDTYLLARDFFHRALVTVSTGLVRNLIIGYTFFMIFHFTLSKALIRMERRVSRFRPEAPLLSRLAIDRHHENDELGSLGLSINRMLTSLESTRQAQQEAQRALEAHQNVLEMTVARRTRALQKLSKRLQVERDSARHIAKEAELAKRKAEKATRDKSRFLAAASHDLRQPLHAMQLLIAALEPHVNSAYAHDLWLHLQHSQRGLSDFLNSMLDLSRLESGVIKPQISTFALEEVFERIDNMYRPLADEKGLDFRVCRNGFQVESDPLLLERILANLVANAIKYTHRGGVVLGCRWRGEFLVVQVWDSGPGIPEAAQTQIFEDFVQLQNPDHDLQQGLGLGLSIVRGLCLLLQHPLNMRSQVGIGTRFSLIIRQPSLRNEHPQLTASL